MTLSGRIAAAQGPDRALDAEIALATGWALEVYGDHRNGDIYMWFNNCVRHKPGLPHFTSSVDAALTLVPEGCDWMKCLDERGNTVIAICDSGGYELGRAIYTGNDAQAIAAAAMKARGL